jgi:hypothetical protein
VNCRTNLVVETQRSHAVNGVMTKRGTIFFLLCLLSAPLQSQEPSVLGAWRQSGVKWKKPPAELHLKQRYAESGILYFGANHEFAVMYGTVIHGPNAEGVSHGDGRVVYLGTWNAEGTALRVKYQLVSRTVLMANEAMPGPMQMGEIHIKKGALLFDKMLFHRDRRLDNELRDISRDERALMKDHR